MAAFYRTTVREFLAGAVAEMMLKLGAGTASENFDLKPDQQAAWLEQARCLHTALGEVTTTIPAASGWGLLFEYQIPGRAKRMDVVLLDGCGIIAVEFKVGAADFGSGDKWQLRGYCWNLRDFHRESCGVPIAPVLVATAAIAQTVEQEPLPFEDRHGVVLQLQLANAEILGRVLARAHRNLARLGSHQLDLATWDGSQALPTQNVIEAAQQLFASHDVREISHAHADNTTEALDAIVRIVRESRAQHRRSICFLTGVPGAGKTLVGLHAAYSPALVEAAGGSACFASGNQPLLDVLQAALTMNRALGPRAAREVRHEVSAPVRNVHEFALTHLLDPESRPPTQCAVIFDEAQRVWDAEKVARGLAKRRQRGHITLEQHASLPQLGRTEPELLLTVMERCPDWCVVVALVGGGQEIHDGEAGLGEWGKALNGRTKPWTIFASPEALSGGTGLAGQRLFESGGSQELDVHSADALHLRITKRSFRAERFAEWVNHVVHGRPDAARALMPQLAEFPILLVRDLNRAREVLREYAGADRRSGLLASSGAMRLRAEGIELAREFRGSLNYPDWFLRPNGDIRSSMQLEVAATEFECQGLELDWTCVCWGGDFVPTNGGDDWSFRSLRVIARQSGSTHRWCNVANEMKREFIRNKYRVLLTRSREGVVIFVPSGDPSDETRRADEFDSIASYLGRSGATPT